MSRRELKMYGLFFVVGLIAICGVRVGLSLLGARDELTVVATIAVFCLVMFLGGFLPDDPPPDRR